MVKQHTVLAFAYNEPGVLNKLLSLVRKKRYNVETITAGHTTMDGISRITISFSHEEGDKISGIVKQIEKITEVITAEDVTEVDSIERELVIYSLEKNGNDQEEVRSSIAKVFGRVIFENEETLVVEVSGNAEQLHKVREELKQYGILQIARTGVVSMKKIQERFV